MKKRVFAQYGPAITRFSLEATHRVQVAYLILITGILFLMMNPDHASICAADRISNINYMDCCRSCILLCFQYS
ncbi:MAG: hypothetical protein GY751_09665 [Bacteroidetes bacterium]|nr:hypothetical protein [Bacteroidota bacterium]